MATLDEQLKADREYLARRTEGERRFFAERQKADAGVKAEPSMEAIVHRILEAIAPAEPEPAPAPKKPKAD